MTLTKTTTLALAGLLFALPARGADFVVDDPSDACARPAPGTLRHAILAANRQPGRDRIVLARPLAGATVELCGCLPNVVESLSIDATNLAADATLDGRHLAGCEMLRFDAKDGDHRLEGALVLSAGFSATGVLGVGADQHLYASVSRIEGTMRPSGDGAIVVEGSLELTRTVVAGNQAAQGGSLVVEAGGRAELREVVLERSSAIHGGAILVRGGTLVVERSALIDNAAEVGGAIYLEQGTVTFDTSTLSGNKAYLGGAVFAEHGELQIADTTVAFNRAVKSGAAIALHEATAYLFGSVLSDQDGANCAVLGKAKLDGDHTLDEDATCALQGRGVITGKTPKLSPLGAFGGFAPAHAIDPSGAAFDTGHPTQCGPTDQRGLRRPAGTRCDLGAVEVH